MHDFIKKERMSTLGRV